MASLLFNCLSSQCKTAAELHTEGNIKVSCRTKATSDDSTSITQIGYTRNAQGEDFAMIMHIITF